MNKFLRFSYVILYLFIFTTLGSAQITISSDEVPTQSGYTTTLYTVTDTTLMNPLPVNLGTTGGPQTWTFDMSTYTGGESFTSVNVDPASTPFAASFPASNFAQYYDADSFMVYTYQQLTSNGIFFLGTAANYPLIGVQIMVEDPPELAIKLPLSQGTAWTEISHDTTDFGLGILNIVKDSTEYLVDAFGTINVPLGSYNSLRLREISTTVSSTYSGGIPLFTDTTRSIYYTWVTENEGILATVESIDDEVNPQFSMAQSVAFRVSAATNIADNKSEFIRDYQLNQNYPNPFNPTTTISFNIPQMEEVEIALFDITGQKVREIVAGNFQAGFHEIEFNASNLSSGIYYYRITAGNWQNMKKMILLK